jgi:uncharacterized membrane protein (UPF0127 family)
MVTHKDLSAGLIIAGVLLGVVAVVVFVILPDMLHPKVDLRLGDGIFRARVALNESDRAKGLSGVKKLDSGQALLIVFPNEDKWGIWMKDMKIPIDIVWLDKNKKVIHIVKNALPEYSTDKTFKPEALAQYVVELPAGTVDSVTIKAGSTAVFQVNSGDNK